MNTIRHIVAGALFVLAFFVAMYAVSFLMGFVVPDQLFQLDGQAGSLTRESHLVFAAFWVIPYSFGLLVLLIIAGFLVKTSELIIRKDE